MKRPPHQDGSPASILRPEHRPWAIYVRVSTADQAREGVSLDAQRAACIGALSRHGSPPHILIEDAGESAKDTRRPGIVRLLSALYAGELGGVIIHKLDRLTRSVIDMYDLISKFEKANVALVSVQESLDTKSAMGRFFVGIIALIAQWERETISERVTMGMRHRKSEGGFIGGRVPAGCVVIGEPGNRQLTIDPNINPEIRGVWSKILDGWTLRKVCDHLNALAIRPGAKVKRWNRQNLQHFLGADRVLGVLVDRETRDRALKALDGRWQPKQPKADAPRVAPAAQSERVWRLAHLARCARCGQRMVGISARGRHGGQFPYLRCSGKRKGACNAPDLPAVAWEDAVVTCVREAVKPDGPLVKQIIEERAKVAISAGAAAERRAELVLSRDKLRERIDRLVELVAEGDAGGRAVAPKLGELQVARELLDNEIAGCDGVLSAARITQQDVDAMMERLRIGLADLPTRTYLDQAAALRVLLVEVIVGADQPIDLALRVPGTAEGFVQQSGVVDRSALRTNPVRLRFPVTVSRRAGKILVEPGTTHL